MIDSCSPDEAALTHVSSNSLGVTDAISSENDRSSTLASIENMKLRNFAKGNAHLNLLKLILCLYKTSSMEDNKAVLTRVLDWLDETLANDPELRDVFRRHAVAAIARKPVDPQKNMSDQDVAKEIREKVVLKWVDFRHGARPELSWAANPVLFVQHVYREWLEKGVLELAHLRHDLPLYNRYTRWIRENPKDALPLEKIAKLTSTDQPIRNGILYPYVPVAALTPEQAEKRRQRMTAAKRRWRKASSAPTPKN